MLQIGSDSSGKALGLHPRLGGLRAIFDAGRLAVVQRSGYPNSSRSHFQGLDIWGTASPSAAHRRRVAGRYLETVPADPLAGWARRRKCPGRCRRARSTCRRSRTPPPTRSAAPTGAEALNERAAATRMASHLPAERPNLAFVNASAQAAFATLDRVGS